MAFLGYLLDHRKYPWLCVVVAVRSNTQINLLVKAILLVSSHQPKERVFWSQGHDAIVEDGRIAPFHVNMAYEIG